MSAFIFGFWNRIGQYRRGRYLCLAGLVLGTLWQWSGEINRVVADNFATTSPVAGERMLVLNDGRILQGMISTLELGYAVDLSSGRITIPFDMVICEATTLPEAYRKQRDAMTKPTAEQHTRLASWCIQQKLYAEAERELEAALKLQPQYHPARRLVEQLAHRSKPRKPEFVDPERQGYVESLIIKREFSTARPIGNLDPPLAQEFVSKIEPLLLNTCSNASCHGTISKNEFRLTPKWNARGNQRHITEQNLEAVIAQIDRANPEQSPLTTKVRGPHGPQHKMLFTGAKAREQQQLLENWTLKVARFLGPPPESQPVAPGLIQQAGFDSATAPRNAETRTAKTERTPSGSQPIREPAPFVLSGQETPVHPPISAGMESRTETESESRLVDEIRQEQAYDPFNPAIFNRKKHGR